MRLISIDGLMYKIKEKDYKELNEIVVNNDTKKYAKILDKIKEDYKSVGYINQFFYGEK